MIETLLLQSKLSVLEKDVKQSLDILNEAKSLPTKYSLFNILSQLETEDGIIRDLFTDWDNVIQSQGEEISAQVLTEFIQKVIRLTKLIEK